MVEFDTLLFWGAGLFAMLNTHKTVLRRLLLSLMPVAEKTLDARGAELQLEGSNVLGGETKVRGRLALGYGTTFGGYNQIIGGTISIGRYCQIAPFVAIYGINHPTNHITTYVNNRLLGGSQKTFQTSRPVVIGNDVWIGHGAVVLPGVTVGDGVVIGAAAVVTKSMPNYTLVAGNPARVVKPRFSEMITKQLEMLRWWDLPTEKIESIRHIFDLDLAADEKESLFRLSEAIKSLRAGGT